MKEFFLSGYSCLVLCKRKLIGKNFIDFFVHSILLLEASFFSGAKVRAIFDDLQFVSQSHMEQQRDIKKFQLFSRNIVTRKLSVHPAVLF